MIEKILKPTWPRIKVISAATHTRSYAGLSSIMSTLVFCGSEPMRVDSLLSPSLSSPRKTSSSEMIDSSSVVASSLGAFDRNR